MNVVSPITKRPSLGICSSFRCLREPTYVNTLHDDMHTDERTNGNFRKPPYGMRQHPGLSSPSDDTHRRRASDHSLPLTGNSAGEGLRDTWIQTDQIHTDSEEIINGKIGRVYPPRSRRFFLKSNEFIKLITFGPKSQTACQEF